MSNRARGMYRRQRLAREQLSAQGAQRRGEDVGADDLDDVLVTGCQADLTNPAVRDVIRAAARRLRDET